MKTFTLEEAQAVLPTIDSLLKRANAARHSAFEIELDLQLLSHRISLRAACTSMSSPSPASAPLAGVRATRSGTGRRNPIHRRRSQGPRTGLLDFPCKLEERIVLLCWKQGETRISHWHTQGRGLPWPQAPRRSLPPPQTKLAPTPSRHMITTPCRLNERVTHDSECVPLELIRALACLGRDSDNSSTQDCAPSLLPLLFMIYVIAFVDRVNIGYAGLDMTRELHFSNEVFDFRTRNLFRRLLPSRNSRSIARPRLERAQVDRRYHDRLGNARFSHRSHSHCHAVQHHPLFRGTGRGRHVSRHDRLSNPLVPARGPRQVHVPLSWSPFLSPQLSEA